MHYISTLVKRNQTVKDVSIRAEHITFYYFTGVRSTFLANELSMLGTIYRVTLLTLQVSMHLEVVLNVWTSVITSRVTDNFYTYCLFFISFSIGLLSVHFGAF